MSLNLSWHFHHQGPLGEVVLDREDQWLLDWFSGLQVKVEQLGRRRKQRRELESQEEKGGQLSFIKADIKRDL